MPLPAESAPVTRSVAPMAAPVAAPATTIGGGGFGGCGAAGMGGGSTGITYGASGMGGGFGGSLAAGAGGLSTASYGAAGLGGGVTTMAAPITMAAPMMTEVVGSTMATPLATTYGALPGMYF